MRFRSVFAQAALALGLFACGEADDAGGVRSAQSPQDEPVSSALNARPTSPRLCGGIAGIPCPGAARCIDNPRDDCDPKQGGADCSGICVCPVMARCTTGYVWNHSPDVCGCEPVE
jgi:hypothetical protein